MSRAARLLPLFFALFFTTAAPPQQREKPPEQKKETGGQTTQQQPPTCPNVTVKCPPKINAGRPATFTASLKRAGPRARREAYRWTVSAGNDRILKEQGAEDVHVITVGTDGLGGKSVSATFTVAGYGPGCENSCETSVAPTPTPTPTQKVTPTTSPTPDAKVTPTISPTPGVKVTPTPTLPANTNNNGGPGVTLTPTTRTPTPTSTTTPPPVAPPSPAPSATPPAAAVTSSPSASPSSTVKEETTGAGLVRSYPTLLLVLPLAVVVAAVAALLIQPSWLSSAKRYLTELRRPADRLTDGGRDETSIDSGTTDQSGDGREAEGVLVGGTTRETDELQCSVYAPHECVPGDGFLVQAFAHLNEHAPQLEALAKEADREASRRGGADLGPVERGQELLFHLDMPGLTVDDPVQPVVWNGKLKSVQFGVTIPETFKPRRVNCKLTVTVKEFPIGHVRFVFDVAAPRPAEEKEEGLAPGGEFVRYRKGFVSYASEDLPEVLRGVQVMKVLGIEFFHALLSLKPGERWEQALYKHIDESDVFFLFWSAAAHKSEWVEKEVRYALDRKGADDARPPEILPVILEGPPEVPPPSYLDERHFNDPLAFTIKGAALSRERKKEA